MVVRAVILDFGGTLAEGSIDWDGYHASVGELLASLGYAVWVGQLKGAIAASLERLEEVRSLGEELTFEEVYGSALKTLGIPAEEGVLGMIHDLFRARFETRLYPCVEQVLSELSRRYKLALVSNTLSDTPRVFLRRSGLAGHFAAIVCSCDLGVRKPNPAIFRHVLCLLGVEPSEAVHVGDGLDTDVEGARRAGIRAILVERKSCSTWSGPSIRSVCELPLLLATLDSP